MMDGLERYARQTRLPQLGEEGQRLLGKARVLVVGVGALGGFLSEFMVRSGVAAVRLVDRDVPATVNLHRQIQFTEADVRNAMPKAEAAALRLAAINSDVAVEGVVADVTHRSLPDLLQDIDIVLDGTDNFETRFVLNDACVKAGIPWVYGGVLGTHGMAMLIRPGAGPCLRCLMPTLPPPGTLPTCETAGVLAPAVAVVASIQATTAIRFLALSQEACDSAWGRGDSSELISIDLWPFSQRTMKVVRDGNCPCCVHGKFDYLAGFGASESLSLCGRNAVQVTPAGTQTPNLQALQQRLAASRNASFAGRLLRVLANDLELLVFPDGRILVLGTTDTALARSVVSDVLGM